MTSAEEAAVEAVARLVHTCADILGANLVSAILHGSLTTDDFQPGESDLDLLLVVERGLTSVQSDALVEAVRTADLGPAAGIDLLVVTRQTAGSSPDSPARELMVGYRPGSGDWDVEGRDDHVPDVWPELSEARTNGRSLMGPEPRDVLGEVPRDSVRENGTAWLRIWLGLTDDEENAVYMVLTACRMWAFAVTGAHMSKTAAARWALEQDPSLRGVELALSARTTSAAPRITAQQVEEVLLRALRDHDIRRRHAACP